MTRSGLLGASVVAFSIAASAAALAHAGAGEAQGARGEAEPREPRVLHHLASDFVEDEPGARVLAALEARVLHFGGRTWLRLDASPIGPRVVAPPGYRGVAGSNRRTAEEIAAALADGRLEVRVRGPRGTARGHAFAGDLSEVLERRLLPDGRVEHVTASFEAPCRDVRFEVDLGGEGTHDVEVLLDGRVRIRATVRLAGGRARIERLESLGAHDGDAS
jgi:hypothetical protein